MDFCLFLSLFLIPNFGFLILMIWPLSNIELKARKEDSDLFSSRNLTRTWVVDVVGTVIAIFYI